MVIFVLFTDSLKLNPQVVPLPGQSPNLVEGTEKERHTLEKIEDAIAIATNSVGLMPGVVFQGRVAQLAQLNLTHKTVSPTAEFILII